MFTDHELKMTLEELRRLPAETEWVLSDKGSIMCTMTSIERTERTWNPAVGCSKISPGCAHCYAEVMARRLKAMGVRGYENGFRLTLLLERLEEPIKRKRPTVYFINSMSDLFHEEIPDSYLLQVLAVIRQAPQHILQILTKRAERMVEFFGANQSPSNVWLGVTVENRAHGLPRLDALRRISASVRFVSVEPLLSIKKLVNHGLNGHPIQQTKGRPAKVHLKGFAMGSLK